MKALLLLIFIWFSLAGMLILIGVEEALSIIISCIAVMATLIYIGITNDPVPLSPEFSKPEIPYSCRLKEIDIEKEYEARWEKFEKMKKDDSVAIEDAYKYYRSRISPFHPVGQYWDKTMWIDRRDGIEYPEWELHPNMLIPVNQEYHQILNKWISPEKFKRDAKRQARREALRELIRLGRANSGRY